jgi:GTP-binding protein EngB required for normal cell division
VVRSIEHSIERWQTGFGYQQVTETVTNTRQKVTVVFLTKRGSLQVKLIEPTDSTSPIHALA